MRGGKTGKQALAPLDQVVERTGVQKKERGLSGHPHSRHVADERDIDNRARDTRGRFRKTEICGCQ